MHWLPLVAMVIASALPFPHETATRIVAASLPPPPRHAPDYNSHRPTDYNFVPADQNFVPMDRNSVPADQNSVPADRNSVPTDYNSVPADYNSVPVDHDSGKQRNQRDFMTNDVSGVYNWNSVNTLEVPPTESMPVRTRDVTADAEIYKNNVDFNSKNNVQDSLTAASPTHTADSERTEKGFEDNLDPVRLELDGLLEGDMFLDAHPRVLFSPSPPQQPPLLLMLEEGGGPADEELGWDNALSPDGYGARREKRSHLTEARWGQRSVCESVNAWVMDKTTAVDNKGNKVSIIQEIQTQSGPIKQYFYETRCRQLPQDGRHEETGVDGASCLGIDKKQWKSKCVAKSSFVRALTKDASNRMGWRWIRIDASCVCVLLSRTNNKAPSGRGRG
ncbi:uncharacterized protein ntf4 [Eucyclogobius newberryi]|uniref:uncharacterized protein ntf4 n=1 Tax=Eucyclogobius newberryi TaxID=166745 RepID=UPI003B5CAF48